MKSKILNRELAEAFKRFGFALYLAWSDTKTRYRRSVLGPFWLVLGTAIGVGGLAFIWSTLFDVNTEDFVISLTVGLVAWYFMSATVTEAASIFYHNRQLFMSMPISSFLVSMQLLFRQLINLMHNLVVVVVAVALFPKYFSFTNLLALPGLLLVAVNLLAVVQIVGYFGARFRDFEPLVAAIMQPLFFLTPVIFRPQQLGSNEFILYFNPFAHWLALIRDPLMGAPASASSWVVVGALTILCWGLALVITASKRRRLVYWVQ